MARAKRQRGISLIEVMVAVTILVIITLFSIPLFTTWNANVRIRSAAESLQNGMRLAQATALSTNSTATLRLTDDATPTAGSGAAPTGVNWVLLDAAGAAIQVKGSESVTGVTMQIVSNGNEDFDGEIVYLNLGQNNLAVSTEFEFNATGADRRLHVIATPGGRVRMCDPERISGDSQACDLN